MRTWRRSVGCQVLANGLRHACAAVWGDDRTRYRAASAVQALAGTAPVPFESGNYAKVHKRYACVKPFRNALHQFAS